MSREMTEKEREAADRRFVMWSAVNFRPQNMLEDVGFKLFVGSFSPSYTARVMHESTYDKLLLGLFTDVRQKVLAEIREQRESCLSVGYEGPFVAGQMDMTTVAGEEYITFTVSYIPPGGASLHRIALATRAFPGSHTATDVEYWLEQVRWNVWIQK